MHCKLSSLPPDEQLARVVSRIYACGMTTTSGGNLSIRGDQGELWITPAEVDKASLSAADIVQVSAGGRHLGKRRASSQLALHEAIYRARPELRALIHVHPEALVAFAVAGVAPDLRAFPQARQICGAVAMAPPEVLHSESAGEGVARVFASSERVKCVIIPNHGVVVGGVDLTDAFQRFETLEFCSRTLIGAAELGGAKSIAELSLASFEALQPTWQLPLEDGFEAGHARQRQELSDIVARACRQRLMISSYGTASMRLEGNWFLMTPNGVARWELEPEDLLLFDDDRLVSGGRPSRAVHLHREIYRRFPDVHAVLMTQAPAAMAHAVARSPIDVRTNPKSWMFVRDIANLPFGQPQDAAARILHSLTPEFPVVLVENDSMIALGGSLLQAFERVEVAEFTARSNLLAARIGGAVRVSADAIDAMRNQLMNDYVAS